MKKFRIVLADDDTEWTQLFELAVSKKDRYELVGIAEDGDSAFQIIKKERPDIVISDILMPKTDGCYLVNSIRQMQNYRPIIYILSGIATDPIVRILQNLEIDYYSLKPVGVNTILSNLDLLIAMRGLMPDQSSQKITIQYTNKLEQRVEDVLMQIPLLYEGCADCLYHRWVERQFGDQGIVSGYCKEVWCFHSQCGARVAVWHSNGAQNQYTSLPGDF